MSDTIAAPNPANHKLLAKIDLLEQALLVQDPQMKTHLAEIHKLLISFEELVHLLPHDKIAKIMEAQQLHTNTTLVASVTAPSKKASVAKKAAGLGMGDL